MRSRSIMKVLQYLDLAIRRIAALYASGDRDEAAQRLAIMRSICERTLRQVDEMETTMRGEHVANEMEAEMSRFLADLPTTKERDGRES